MHKINWSVLLEIEFASQILCGAQVSKLCIIYQIPRLQMLEYAPRAFINMAPTLLITDMFYFCWLFNYNLWYFECQIFFYQYSKKKNYL